MKDLSNVELIEKVKRLAAAGCRVEAELLEHLAEVDQRKLYLDEGCPSMFAYCTEVLHFSEAASSNRIVVARALQVYPALLVAVRDGSQHLSGVRALVPHLTLENHRELLEATRHQTRRAIERLLADRAPRPDARTWVGRVPSPKRPAEKPTSEPSAAHPRPPEPLGLGRFRVQFTLDAATEEQLREVRSLLRHQIPDGDLGAIFARALGLLCTEVRKAKFAETPTPRRTPRPP
jgi:hypothetical protein